MSLVSQDSEFKIPSSSIHMEDEDQAQVAEPAKTVYYDPHTLVESHGPLPLQFQRAKFKVHRFPQNPTRCVVEVHGMATVTVNAWRLACMQLVPSVGIRFFAHVRGPLDLWPDDTLMHLLKRVQVQFDPFLLEELPVVCPGHPGPPDIQDLTPENSLLFRLFVPKRPRSEWNLPRMEGPEDKKAEGFASPPRGVLHHTQKMIEEYQKISGGKPPWDPARPPRLIDEDRVPRAFAAGLRSVRLRDFQWIPLPGQRQRFRGRARPRFTQPNSELFKIGPWHEVQIDCYAVRCRGLLGAELKTDEMAQPGYVLQRQLYHPVVSPGLTEKQKLTLYRTCKSRQNDEVPVFDQKILRRDGSESFELSDIEDLPGTRVHLNVARPWGCTNCRRCDQVVDIQEQKNAQLLDVQSAGALDPLWIVEQGKRLLLEEYQKKRYDPALARSAV